MNANLIQSQVIDILVRDNLDYRAIVIALAKRHPEVLVELAGPKATGPQWQKDVVAFVVAGNNVGGIKLYREKTGAGLLEAKRTIDYLQNILFQWGKSDRYHDFAPECRPSAEQIANAEMLYASSY